MLSRAPATALCLYSLILLAASATAIISSPFPTDHNHAIRGALPHTWYQRDDHPAYTLFRRNGNRGTVDAPTVGSPAWTSAYPSGTPPASSIPTAWTDALNAAVAKNLIPDVPQTTESGGNTPVYPAGVNPSDPSVCNAGQYTCRIPGNVWDAPNGTIGIGFDDGPTEFSPALYTFLKKNKQRATHFMIGVNILTNPSAFLQAYADNGDDIAVHTWTHPYMTTLSNAALLGQFGWTMQLIHDSTGGKLPRFWRPPYGDLDTRVSALALEVFGLTAIIWNHDTADWSIPSGGQTIAGVQANMKTWLSGPKSPGLIVLEHELYNQTVEAFMEAWPMVAQYGWTPVSTAEVNKSVPVWQGGGTGNTGGNGSDLADPAFSADLAASAASPTTSGSARPGGNGTAGTGTGTRTGLTGMGTGSAPKTTGPKSGAALRARVPVMSSPLVSAAVLLAAVLALVAS